MSTLHDFGLQGVRPTFFEHNPNALRQTLERLDVQDKLLRDAPIMRAFLQADPDGGVQLQAQRELQSIVAAAADLARVRP